MESFPFLDAVALPAPVVIFKVLLFITSALHFVAVEVFLGGVLAAIVLNYVGQSQSRYTNVGMNNLSSAAILARRLPVVLTFVINFAFPPLLFTQVLYGRALYTSSILIGGYWIALIGLLMFCYWLLYKMADRSSRGDSILWVGILAWLTAAGIGKILSLNMTLMLRPEVWPNMYAASASGLFFPPHDPTMFPRWAFMILGGLVGGGAWMMWLGGRPSPEPNIRASLSKLGAYLVQAGIPIQILACYWVWHCQPTFIKSAALEQGLLGTGGVLFLLCWAVLWGIAFNRAQWGLSVRIAGNLSAIVGVIGFLFATIARDSIRDLTLANKGMDIWNRPVEANYFVLALFLIIFVIGLCVMTWLIWVTWSSKAVSDRVNPGTAVGTLTETKPGQAFPADKKNEDPICPCKMTRGAFLGTALTAVGMLYAGTVSYLLYRYVNKRATGATTSTQDAGASTEKTLLLPGAAKIPVQSILTFNFRGHYSLLIHHADNTWTAMDGICTHQGCKVRYEAEQNRVFCPCHSAVFNSKTGAVEKGPAIKPLPTYHLEVKGEDIIIS